MVAITLPILLSAFAATAFAVENFQLARRVFPDERANLERRTDRTLGGYALRPNFQEHCPNDMLSCSGGGYCCPMTFECNSGADVDDACCPAGVDCAPPLLDAPYCVDDSWSLWDESAGGIVKANYFCCSPGHVGTLSGTCIDETTVSSPTIEALRISPGGGVIETSTVVVSTAAGSAANSVTQVTVSTTTTTGGSTSVTTSTSLATSVATKGTTSTTVVAATGGSATSTSASATATKSSGADKNMVLGFGAAWAVQGVLAVAIGAAL